MIGLLVEHLAENVLGRDVVVGEQRCAGLIDHEIQFGGEDPFDPSADVWLGQRTRE